MRVKLVAFESTVQKVRVSDVYRWNKRYGSIGWKYSVLQVSRLRRVTVRIFMTRSFQAYPSTSIACFASIAATIALAPTCSNKVEVLTSETGGTFNASSSGGSASTGGSKPTGGNTSSTGGSSLVLPKPCPGIILSL